MIRAKKYPDAQTLTDAVIELLRKQFAASPGGDHAVMLAGGSTPMAAYAAIAARPVQPGTGLHLCFSDDRYVPADSPKSNYGNTLPLIRALGLSDERVMRVHGEDPIQPATDRFGKDLGDFLARGGRVALGLLGLGADGHTASLFSKDDIDRGKGHWSVAVKRPDGMEGISVTPEFLARIDRIIFLVSGADKKPMALKLLKESLTIPAGMAVAACPSVELWSDPAAWPG
jgi:6-phosphogluconolactonase/glucosamine-6-phosphate isomerase/deaminase